MIAAYPVREISYLFCMTSATKGSFPEALRPESLAAHASRANTPEALPETAHSPLRVARQRAGLTVAEMARLSGVTERTINNVENGRHPPARATRILLASALGMELHDLWPQHTPPMPVAIGGPRPVGDDDAAVWAYRQAGDSTGAGELLGIHSDGIRKRLNHAGAAPRPRGGSNAAGVESLAAWARKLGVPIEQAIDAATRGRVPGAFVQTLDCPVIGVRWAVRREPARSTTGQEQNSPGRSE